MVELIESYRRQVEAAKDGLSQTCYESLINRVIETLDDLETATNEFSYSLLHAEYYKLLDRIEKGYEVVANETDEAKKEKYQRHLKSLISQFESIGKEIAA